MTILLFIAVLLVVVIVHEWGHFFVAKKSGMIVEEFGFGIPPKIFSWGKGETKYSINALPIGGFVKIAGENGWDEKMPKERQFEAKPWYAKSTVLVAGVVCNILLAFLLFTSAYMIGLPAPTETGVPKALAVLPNSPASNAGISVGDIIESISIKGVVITPINTTTLRAKLQQDPSPIVIKYFHGNVSKIVTVTPNIKTKTIGLGIEKIENVKQPFGQAVRSATQQIFSIGKSILSTLGSLVSGLFLGNFSAAGLMGPVGLAKEVGSAATFGFAYLLAFTAAISVNLAVLNIMPFPALDGGRLLVVILEAISRKKFSQNMVNIIHTVGFSILILLMIILTVSDIRKTL